MRKLTPEVREQILQTFKDRYMHESMPGYAVADLCRKHGIGLLEIADEHPEWFEKKESK